MKNKKLLTIMLISIFCYRKNGFSQSTSAGVGFAGHLGFGPADYLGWINNTIPLRFETFNTERIRINNNQTTPTTFAAGPQNKDGFIGINRTDPWSRLHISSAVTGQLNSGGYRPWMREGIIWQSVTDMIFIGHKRWGGGIQVDQQNAIINWGDDQGGFSGPDHMVFNYTETSQLGPYAPSGITPNPATVDGRDIMRLTNIGNIGIGPRFNNSFIPQSTLHQHQENSSPSWMQITNQASRVAGNPATNVTSATPTSPNDGLRWGIDGVNNAYIFNQENRHLIFSSNATTANLTQERIRLTAINTPGTSNPGGLPNNITRFSISRDPINPANNPLSLVHLGYNTGAGNDGWRSWMDIGTFMSNGTDHVFIGLKDEGGNILSDRQDAVISWGDNQTSPNGPDNLRFIFTSNAAGTAPANGINGLEGMRMTPTTANNVFTGIGGVPAGINPYVGGSQNPTQTLEVNSTQLAVGPSNSGLRFTDLNSTATPLAVNPGLGVLAVDANGDVVYVPASAGGTGVGNLCINPQNPLPSDYEIPLNQNNYYFSGSQVTGDKVAVGVNCGTPLPSKFNVVLNQTYNTSFVIGNNAGYFRNSNSATAHNVGVKGESTAGDGDNSGGYFKSSSNSINSTNNGVWAESANSPNTNRGGFFRGLGGNDAVGITAMASGGALTNYAGVFNGDVYINGMGTGSMGVFYLSDQVFKNNIDSIANVSNIIKQLKPKIFYFDTTNVYNVAFSSKKQYGLIAQDVESVLPELVGNSTKPAEYDSLGNVTVPAVTYKNLNYNAFIAILIKGMQTQQQQINKQDSVINLMQTQIAALTSSVSSCCSSTAVRATKPEELNQLTIDLSDKDVIVLNQNVPNPFAEQTTITYNVPEKYNFAQIIFSTIEGKIIKAVDIAKKGRGQLNVFANDLSSGMYTYSLVVDGKIMGTKKMVKSE